MDLSVAQAGGGLPRYGYTKYLKELWAVIGPRDSNIKCAYSAVDIRRSIDSSRLLDQLNHWIVDKSKYKMLLVQ